MRQTRDYSSLREIGLSKTAVRCYQSLANDGPAKVSVLAKRLQLPRTGLYRVLEKLYDQGFVFRFKVEGASTSYSAEPLYKAIEKYFKYQKRLMTPLLGGYEDFAAKRDKES